MKSVSIVLNKSDDLFGDDSYIFDLNLQSRGVMFKTSFRMYNLEPLKMLINAYFMGKNGHISSWFDLSKNKLSIKSVDSNVLNDLIITDPKQIYNIVKKLNNLIERI